MKTKRFLFIAAAILLALASCQKNNSLIDQTSLDLADDDAVADAVYEDIFNSADIASIMLEQVAKGEELSAFDSCPAVIVTRPTASPWPKRVTIDYGTQCTLNNSVRSGKILIEVTGPRLETGSKRTVTFDNYYFNGMKVEGTKVLENKGYNSNQNLVVAISVTGGKLTLPDGRIIERTVNHEREWIAGLLTRSIWDDECLVTGTATGKNINGLEYTNTILTPLHWVRACRFITAGIVKFEREGKDPVELNYGTGICDPKAVVTRGDQSKEILLRHRHRTMGN